MASIRWNSVAENLLRWFSRTKEGLPWRTEPRDPYVVWVSEVILQQTRAAARLLAIKGQVTEKQVRAKLEPLLPHKKAGAFNETLMELGRRICRPKNPLCGECPFRRSCRAHALGKAGEFPQAKKKSESPEVRRIALVKIRGGRILLRQKPEREMLGGLWGFPLVGEKDIGALKGESLAPSP